MIKAATRGLHECGGDGGEGGGIADYAKDFHNIRRLKFSHNIRLRAAARQREKEDGERAGPRKRRATRGGRSQGREACVAPGVLG